MIGRYGVPAEPKDVTSLWDSAGNVWSRVGDVWACLGLDKEYGWVPLIHTYGPLYVKEPVRAGDDIDPGEQDRLFLPEGTIVVSGGLSFQLLDGEWINSYGSGYDRLASFARGSVRVVYVPEEAL